MFGFLFKGEPYEQTKCDSDTRSFVVFSKSCFSFLSEEVSPMRGTIYQGGFNRHSLDTSEGWMRKVTMLGVGRARKVRFLAGWLAG